MSVVKRSECGVTISFDRNRCSHATYCCDSYYVHFDPATGTLFSFTKYQRRDIRDMPTNARA